MKLNWFRGELTHESGWIVLILIFPYLFGVRDGKKQEFWRAWCSCPSSEAVYKWGKAYAFERTRKDLTVDLKVYQLNLILKCNYFVIKTKHSKLAAIVGSWKNSRTDWVNLREFFRYPSKTRRPAPWTMMSPSLRWLF